MKLLAFVSLFAAAYAQTTADPCPLAGTEPDRNEDGSVQYVIDFFSGLPFAFALGFCNPQEIFGGQYAIYECDGEQMTKTIYDAADCSGDPATAVQVWNHSSAGVVPGSGYPQDYSCSGAVAYAVTSFDATSDQCTLPTTTYGATGVCVTNGPENNMVYCNANSGQLQYYTVTGPEVTCNDDQYCRAADVTETCNYMFTVLVESTPVDIYGFITDCFADYGQTEAPDTTESDDPAFIARAGLAMLFAFLAYLMQ